MATKTPDSKKEGLSEAIDTSLEAGQTVVFEDLVSNEIHTTEDKLELCLIKNKKLIFIRRDLYGSLGLLLATGVPLLMADFKDFGWISSQDMRSMFFLGAIASVLLFLDRCCKLVANRKKDYSDEVIQELKNKAIIRKK